MGRMLVAGVLGSAGKARFRVAGRTRVEYQIETGTQHSRSKMAQFLSERNFKIGRTKVH
jgi:hypothetical protein